MTWRNNISPTKPRDESHFEYRVLQYVHLRKVEPRPLTRVVIDVSRPEDADDTKPVSTMPDQVYYFHVTMKGKPVLKARLAVYIDLEQIHLKGFKPERNQLRRDRAREEGWQVEAYTYRRNTKKRMREIGDEIIALVKKIDQHAQMEAAIELGLLPEEAAVQRAEW